MTTSMQMAALVTMRSTLGSTYAMPAQATAQVTTSPELVLAINFLTANQKALSQHMAAMSFHAQPPFQACTFPAPHPTWFHMPPIQKLTIPGMTHYNAGGFNHGQGGWGVGGCGLGQGRGRLSCTPFANHMAARGVGFQGGSGAQPLFLQVGRFQNFNAQCMNPPHSNVTKNKTT
jgi:hypothetical protein